MFLRHSEPLGLSSAGLLGVCASLNRPVVELEGLSVGTARAVIALHRSPGSGELCLAVALRSIESGAVTLFTFQGELSGAPYRALDAALSFAEGMGFLFDEDMIAGSQDAAVLRRALACWCALVGEEMPPELEPVPTAGDPVEMEPAKPGDGLLLLDEMVDLIEAELDQDAFVPPEDPGGEQEILLESSTSDPAVANPSLSKFRFAAAASERAAPNPPPNPPPAARRVTPEPAAAESGGAHLGRIAIVRKRVREEAPAPDLISRILASF